jgi:secondary thiamine-phosphate synthase enzyme
MEFKVETTKKEEVVDITEKVREILKESKVKNGIMVVYVKHATAGIIINENYDPNVCLDFLDALKDLIPAGKWRHDKVDGNTDAHIKASIIGPSETLIIENNDLVLGTWQNLMLVSWDGPRTRTIKVEIIENKNI